MPTFDGAQIASGSSDKAVFTNSAIAFAFVLFGAAGLRMAGSEGGGTGGNLVSPSSDSGGNKGQAPKGMMLDDLRRIVEAQR